MKIEIQFTIDLDSTYDLAHKIVTEILCRVQSFCNKLPYVKHLGYKFSITR